MAKEYVACERLDVIQRRVRVDVKEVGCDTETCERLDVIQRRVRDLSVRDVST